MNIAIIGAGKVGKALASSWKRSGHHVIFGVRDPETDREGLAKNVVTSISKAADCANVIVLAMPWKAVPEALAAAGNIKNKIVIDATNPLGMLDGRLALVTTGYPSGAAFVAAHAPGARIVKALNQTGFENLADPAQFSQRPVMFVAGEDADAKDVVLSLVNDLGFEAFDAGPLSTAALLEAFGMLWINHAIVNGQGRNLAFALLQAKADPSNLQRH
jgi:8-hydroxy-5-deazaflavin:NADPH oxidoreductase